MIVDGRAMAQDILKEVRENSAALESVPMIRAVTVSPTPVTRSYLRAKTRAAEAAGMQFEVIELPIDSRTEDFIDAVLAPGADAVIVQLPLPMHIDERRVLAAIPLKKDADALTQESRESGTPVQPVAVAVEEIFLRSGISIEGKQVVVIGKGRLVGEPVAARLASLGAEVTAYDEHTFSPEVLATADIVVSGAGVPHLVQPEMLKDGVVLIDGGTSEENGAIAGDIDPSCAIKASVYTPVPGGVGPLAVACLMRNVLSLVQKVQKAG